MSIIQNRISKHVLWATVNRPGARNAVDFEVMSELEALAEQVETDNEIRVLILSGSGQSFVSGGDLKKFHTLKSEHEAEKMSRRMHGVLNRIESLPCWTIACVNGDAYGGGIELMLAFDFRVAAPTAKFGFTQSRFYLVPGWGGLTRLVEKVGRANALHWLGKSAVLPAHEVFAHGMIEHILPGKNIEQETQQWAEKLTKNDRDFIRVLKKGALQFSQNRAESIESEIKPFTKLWVHEKHEKRVNDFLAGNKK